jgi:hypothetical protein
VFLHRIVIRLDFGSKLGEEEVELLRGAENGGRTTDLAGRVSKLTGLEHPRTGAALIAPGRRVATMRTGTGDVPVGKEPILLGAIWGILRPLLEVPFLEESEEDLLHGSFVRGRVGMGVKVERKSKAFERNLVDLVELTGEFLR